MSRAKTPTATAAAPDPGPTATPAAGPDPTPTTDPIPGTQPDPTPTAPPEASAPQPVPAETAHAAGKPAELGPLQHLSADHRTRPWYSVAMALDPTELDAFRAALGAAGNAPDAAARSAREGFLASDAYAPIAAAEARIRGHDEEVRTTREVLDATTKEWAKAFVHVVPSMRHKDLGDPGLEAELKRLKAKLDDLKALPRDDMLAAVREAKAEVGRQLRQVVVARTGEVLEAAKAREAAARAAFAAAVGPVLAELVVATYEAQVAAYVRSDVERLSRLP